MKCPECGYNSFDYLESCKKCGASLYPDPLLTYAHRKAEQHEPDDSREVHAGDETAEREMPRISVPGTDAETSAGEPVHSQHNRSSGIGRQEIGRESFEGAGISKGRRGRANEKPGFGRAGVEMPLFAGDDEIPGPEEFPLMFDEIDEAPDRHDPMEELEFNGEKPELFNLAGFGARAAAFVLDIFIVSVTAFLSIAAGLYMLNGQHAENPGLERVVVPLYIALFFLASTYFVFLHGFGGKTVGKMVFGIRLINGEGESIGLWDAFIRWIGYFVSAGFFLIGFAWSFFDAEGQTWHDKIAGTYVVRD